MVEARLEKISIDQIELDDKNPRIQRALEMYGDSITAERIALALEEGSGSSGTFLRLKNSIKTHGGIVTPIIVNHVKGKNICVEGNTRLHIYKEFRDERVSGDWSFIKAYVYEDVNQESIDSIRLQAHLIGPRQWTPYAKARYLKKLYDEEFLTFPQIVDYCGGNQKDIERQLSAFNMVEEIYRPMLDNPDDFREDRFSGFVEYQDNKIKEAVYEAGFEDKDFCKWLHDNKISHLNHVRQLKKILENPKAKKEFLNDNSQAAIRILNSPTVKEILEKTDLITLLDIVQQKIDRFEYDEIEKLNEPHEMIDALSSASESVNDFIKQIKKIALKET